MSAYQQLQDAKRLARQGGCFIAEKGGRYLVYRVTPTKNVFCGSTISEDSLLRRVRKVTGLK